MRVDLAIVGSGPAGLSAAIAARKLRLSVVVLDEAPHPGGRLLCQLHEDPSKPAGQRLWVGRQVAADLVSEARDLGVDLMMSAPIWGIFGAEPNREDSLWHVMLGSSGGSHGGGNGSGGHSGRAAEVIARSVLIATGAAEQPLPLPGWTLPGVVTAGAAQVMANQWRVRPGNRAFIIGMDPLAFTTAHALTMAGVQVAGMANPPPGALAGEAALPHRVLSRLASLAHLAPSSLLRLAGPLAKIPAIAKAASALYAFPAVKVWGAPVMLRHAAVGIRGDGAVSSVTLMRQRPDGTLVPGSRRAVEVDLVCLAGGLNPLTELAAAAGCEFAYVSELGGHVPAHGPFGQTTLPGLYVAGNITGVESAPVAIQQGALTGQAIGLLLSGRAEDEVLATTEDARSRVSAARRQASLEFVPGIEKGRHAMARLWERRGQNQ